jgi:site-specific recombinase XerD
LSLQKTAKTATRTQYNTPFERFVNSLNSEITVKNYTKCLNYFLKYCQLTDYNQLLSSEEFMDDNKKSDLISDYLVYLRKERKLSSSYINGVFSAIKRFYIVNKIKLDWDQLALTKAKQKAK